MMKQYKSIMVETINGDYSFGDNNTIAKIDNGYLTIISKGFEYVYPMNNVNRVVFEYYSEIPKEIG